MAVVLLVLTLPLRLWWAAGFALLNGGMCLLILIIEMIRRREVARPFLLFVQLLVRLGFVTAATLWWRWDWLEDMPACDALPGYDEPGLEYGDVG